MRMEPRLVAWLQIRHCYPKYSVAAVAEVVVEVAVQIQTRPYPEVVLAVQTVVAGDLCSTQPRCGLVSRTGFHTVT